MATDVLVEVLCRVDGPDGFLRLELLTVLGRLLDFHMVDPLLLVVKIIEAQLALHLTPANLLGLGLLLLGLDFLGGFLWHGR